MNDYEYERLDVTEQHNDKRDYHSNMVVYQMEEYGVKQSFDRKGFYYKKGKNNERN